MKKQPKQIAVDRGKAILSRTDIHGNILYCNDYFEEIHDCKRKEILFESHKTIHHPDMPKVIFKWMWQRLKNGQGIVAIVKNKAKNDNFYWCRMNIEISYHPIKETPDSYLAMRRAVPKYAVKKIEPLYKELIKIEREKGIAASEIHLLKFLRKQDTTYDAYIQSLLTKKTFIQKIFRIFVKNN